MILDSSILYGDMRIRLLLRVIFIPFIYLLKFVNGRYNLFYILHFIYSDHRHMPVSLLTSPNT